MPPFSLNDEIIDKLKMSVIKIAKAMNLRFYFNVITITLFMYLLKAPIDGFCDFLFMIDLDLGFKEMTIL